MRYSRPPHGVPTGFSLLEALLALVIVSISLGVLFQIVSGSMRLGFQARENYVAVHQAQEIFAATVPRSPVWEDLVWTNSTDDFEWVLEIHPVALRESFEDGSITAGDDLLKIVFLYTDRSTGRPYRFFAYRRVPQDSLRIFLKENKEHVVWDEFDQFKEFITP